MRINQFIAQATGLSRRKADQAILEGRVTLNGKAITVGIEPHTGDSITLDGKIITPPVSTTTIMLNKPVGYVCSRDGQGSDTVYDLLPPELHQLKPVGRLDKDSSGLLLLTNDGQLAQKLTHPSQQKIKKYEVELDHDLTEIDFDLVTKQGVLLDDGLSKLGLDYVNNQNTSWKVTMNEGRNRQIRRTFNILGYRILKLHRTHFGPYSLDKLKTGSFSRI